MIGEASLWISYLVKREIVISRDPFSMVGLTNEFAFALISGGDELYLAYKDLDDEWILILK